MHTFIYRLRGCPELPPLRSLLCVNVFVCMFVCARAGCSISESVVWTASSPGCPLPCTPSQRFELCGTWIRVVPSFRPCPRKLCVRCTLLQYQEESLQLSSILWEFWGLVPLHQHLPSFLVWAEGNETELNFGTIFIRIQKIRHIYWHRHVASELL